MKVIPLTAAWIALSFFSARPQSVFAQAALLSLTPANQTVKVGQTLTTTILLDTGGEQINRVLVKINHNSDLLIPQSIDQTGSFVTLWYQQNISTPGVVVLEGGVSGTGVSGSQMTFAKINFMADQAGQVTLSFAGDSAVFRESDGSNILSGAQTATYTIESLTPTPVTTPGATATPTPTLLPARTPTTTPLPGTPTPTRLPAGGTWPTTIVFIALAGILSTIGFLIMRKT